MTSLRYLVAIDGNVFACLSHFSADPICDRLAGALFFRLRVHDSVGYLLADAALLGLATATAVLRLS